VNISNANRFVANVYNQSADFNDRNNQDYALGANSAARNIGDPAIGALIPFDLANLSRLVDGQPDAGAFERQ
jgi:hypothetical protein